MRGLVLCVCLAVGSQVGAEPELRTSRWQQATDAPALARVWGAGSELYGVGTAGAFRSTDGGATWNAVGDRSAAAGVWGTAPDDVWVIRARTVHHSTDGAGEHWLTRTLPVSFGTQLEGMWGTGSERYVFGADRSDNRGVILHSRDGGTSWQREAIDIERVAGIWGSSTSDVYAVGSRGAILHSTGNGSWQVVRAPTSGSLEGIWGVNAKQIYAVGSGGTILFFDGKTWAARRSGASYTLTSIVGLSNRELFAGSVDGAPLRSNDGVTWKPLTALVPRGQVWAGDERVVVASSEVHYFGDAPASESIRNPVPVELRGLFMQFAQYPAAMELVQHAAHRLDASYRPPLGRPGVPKLRILSVSNCSAALDALRDPVPDGSGTQMWVALRCEKPCNAGPVLAVTQEITLVIDGVQQKKTTTTFDAPNLCNKDPRTGVLNSDVIGAFERQLAATRDTAIALATSDNAKFEAQARYAIDGGTHFGSHQAIATLLNKPMSWRGFFWADQFALAPPPSPGSATPCDPLAIADLEHKGDEAMIDGHFAQALTLYGPVLRCNPAIVQKSYLAACRARNFAWAKRLFAEIRIRNPNLVQICLKEGFDPSKP